jgi:hypothetical protein
LRVRTGAAIAQLGIIRAITPRANRAVTINALLSAILSRTSVIMREIVERSTLNNSAVSRWLFSRARSIFIEGCFEKRH